MKLLHTSDLHLGKKLFQKDRLPEQERSMRELIAIAKNEKVDLVIIAGDIFDSTMPPPKAEELFFELSAEISRHAVLLVLAGNHDDAERLKASKELARIHNIIIVGDLSLPPKTKITTATGEGWMRLRLNDEEVNIVAVPYFSDAKMGWNIGENETFAQRTSDYLNSRAKECFTDSGINLLAGHLFLSGSVRAGGERDIELGTARIIDTERLPDCHYGAFGHIHKRLRLKNSKTEHIHYSGSIMQYSFDEVDIEKSVNLVSLTNIGVTDLKYIPLNSGRRLKTIEADSIGLAEKLLNENKDYLVQLILLDGAIDDIRALKALRQTENLALLKILPKTPSARSEIKDKVLKGGKEIFLEYCLSLGIEKDDDLTRLFLDLTE